jgi:hypothetical protein
MQRLVVSHSSMQDETDSNQSSRRLILVGFVLALFCDVDDGANAYYRNVGGHILSLSLLTNNHTIVCSVNEASKKVVCLGINKYIRSIFAESTECELFSLMMEGNTATESL